MLVTRGVAFFFYDEPRHGVLTENEMGSTSVLELLYGIKESSLSAKVKVIIKEDHNEYLKNRIKKKDINEGV